MKNYTDSFQGNILDPIHGVIKISEIEKWFLFQKPFNRLKRIKQNTFLYYVFPSANHTRFEHSIGVMHLASEIFEYLCKNYVSYDLKAKKYQIKEPNEFSIIDIKSIFNNELEIRFQELRLAALLHDIGHGPMSHKFDDFTLEKNQFLEIIDSDDDIKKYRKAFEMFLDKPKLKGKTKVDHEVVSCLFVLKLVASLKKESSDNSYKFEKSSQEIIQQINAENIVKMIEPDFDFSSIVCGDYDFTDYFSSIISSFPIDVDRMDYLLRDSYFSGVNYGLYDLSRLFMSLLPVAKGKKVKIAIKESGLESVIRFIQSRTHLYNQIYYHKTNRSANKLLDFSCRKLVEKGKSIIEATDYKQLDLFYWQNSDELFLWKTLEDKIDDKNSVEYETLQDLRQRKLWKRVYESITFKNEMCAERKKEIKTQVDKIAVNLKTLEPEIICTIDIAFSESMKDADKSKICFYYKEDKEYKLRERFWNSEDVFQLNKIKYTEIFIRIYLQRKFKTPAEYLEKRDKVIKVAKESIEELEALLK